MQISETGRNALIEEFYLNHTPWLYSWLCKKLGSTFDAADLTQDTFMRMLLKPDLHAIAEPRAYLTTIAHGLMANHIRRRELERAYMEELASAAPAEQPSPECRALALELLIRIDASLDGLKPKVRMAFLLSQMEGLPHAEIAARLGVSVATVRLYIAKTLKHLLHL